MRPENRLDSASKNVRANLFLTPTGFTHREYADAFGQETADELYNALYGAAARATPFRQIVPVQRLADSYAVKYVFQLHDRRRIESVCITRRTGTSICLSTQVGCSVRCAFCISGSKGLFRNLSASEIVQQLLFVDEEANRIVFMGIGEPLHNYAEVMKAIHILRDRKGINFPTEGITVSTVGPVERLRQLREEHLKIQLVLSLHATDQCRRDAIIPGMSRYSINETVAEAMAYAQRHNRRLTVAYLLIPGFNDREDDLERLARWFRNKNVRLNLLTYNGPAKGAFRAASNGEIGRVTAILRRSEIEVSVRESYGCGINAACGQLVSS